MGTWMIRTAAIVALTAALGACASGGGNDNGGDERTRVRALMSADALMFTSFDANGDLSITTDEIDAGMNREFARADSNSDGALSPIEFQNWSNQVLGGTQMGPFRLDFDRNVDNTITRAEFDAEIRGRVEDYDSDENGSLTRSEFVRVLGQARAAAPTRVRMEERPVPPQR